ncbi:MAG: O-antigen ligase family protein [Candidatus Eremiobacterota bacterium]
MKIPVNINNIKSLCIHLLIAGVPLLFYINHGNPFLAIKWTYFRIILLFMIFISFIDAIKEEKIVIYNIKINIPVIVFILCASLSYSHTFTTGMNFVAVTGYWNIICMIIFFSIIVNYYISETVTYYHMRTAIIVCSIVSVYGICQHFGLDRYEWVQKSSNFESISTIGNSNLLGLFLNIAWPLPVVYGIYSRNRTEKILYFASSILMLICLYFTYCRGSMLAFLLSLPFWLLIFRVKIKRILIYMLIIIIPLISVGILYRETLMPEINKFTRVESITVRIFLWKTAVKMLIEHPGGTGFDSYTYYYLKYRKDEPLVNRRRLAYAENSHNEFLDIGISTGIPGLISFVIFTGMIITGGFRKLPDLSGESKTVMTGSILCLIAYIINLNTVFSEISSQMFFWFFLGIILAEQIKNNSDKKIYSLKKISAIKYAIIFCLLLITVFLQWKSVLPFLAESYIYEGKEETEKGNFKGATDKITEALKLDPQNWDYWLIMAKTFEGALNKMPDNKELAEGAILAYKTSIKLNPLNAYPHADLGRMYSMYSDISGNDSMNKSIEEYEYALKLDPYNIFFYNDMGTTYMRKGEIDNAIYCYRKSLDIFKSAATYNMLGRALSENGDLKEGEECLKKSIELDSNSGSPYFNLALLYIKKGKREEAFKYLDRAFYLDPQNSEIGRAWIEAVTSDQ